MTTFVNQESDSEQESVKEQPNIESLLQKLSIKVKSPLSQALRSASTVLDEELL